MLSGDFARKLKQLNKNLRISCGDDPKRAACLYYSVYNMGVDEDETDYVEICGIDKNEVPEWLILDETNHIVKSGWRRVLNILISRKLVDKRKAENLFRTSFDKAVRIPINRDTDPILTAIRQAEEMNLMRKAASRLPADVAKKTYRTDDLMDIGRMIHKQKNRG